LQKQENWKQKLHESVFLNK